MGCVMTDFFSIYFVFFFYLAVGNVIIIFDFKIISVFNSIFIYLLVCICVCEFHISFFGDLHPELCCCCLLPLYLFIWKIFIMLIGFHIFPFTKTIFVLYKFFSVRHLHHRSDMQINVKLIFIKMFIIVEFNWRVFLEFISKKMCIKVVKSSGRCRFGNRVYFSI